MAKGVRGGRYTTTTSSSIPNQVPTQQNTPVQPQAVITLQAMDDDALAQLAKISKTVSMPNFLADADDPTQKFVFAAGLNEKPMVLDDNAFYQYMKDNNISNNQILARNVTGFTYTNQGNNDVTLTADQITDMMKYSRLNYIGGKHGGQAYGAGAYFDMNGGKSTGYAGASGGKLGKATTIAVLNPKTTRAIDLNNLEIKARTFAANHPKFAAQVGQPTSYGRGNNISIYALAMGYNVITDSANYPSYHNVIDRSALVYRKSNL